MRTKVRNKDKMNSHKISFTEPVSVWKEVTNNFFFVFTQWASYDVRLSLKNISFKQTTAGLNARFAFF